MGTDARKCATAEIMGRVIQLMAVLAVKATVELTVKQVCTAVSTHMHTRIIVLYAKVHAY